MVKPRELLKKELDSMDNITDQHMHDLFKNLDVLIAERKKEAEATTTNDQKEMPHKFSQEESDRIDGITNHHMQELFKEMDERRAKREAEVKNHQ